MKSLKVSETKTNPSVLVVGETLVDVIHRADGSIDEKPGGSCANVAISLGRLERSPRLLTNLGDDKHGREARAWLEESGVVVRAQKVSRTSSATAYLDSQGAASYEFSVEWKLIIESADEVDVLHLGSIAAIQEPGATAVSNLVDHYRGRTLVTYDPNIRPSLVDDADAVRQRILSFIERSDVVKASDDDIAWLHPGEDIETAARRWATSGPALVVVTLGAAGSLAITQNTLTYINAVPVEVADTVGAGDTFMGALIDGLMGEGALGSKARPTVESLSEAQISSLLQKCALSAAVTVSRPGADPPTREELESGLLGGTAPPSFAGQ